MGELLVYPYHQIPSIYGCMDWSCLFVVQKIILVILACWKFFSCMCFINSIYLLELFWFSLIFLCKLVNFIFCFRNLVLLCNTILLSFLIFFYILSSSSVADLFSLFFASSATDLFPSIFPYCATFFGWNMSLWRFSVGLYNP